MPFAEDLKVLKNYLWTDPSEIELIGETLDKICENPISGKLTEMLAMADEAFNDFKDNLGNNRAFVKIRNELVRLYADIHGLYDDASDSDKALIDNTVAQLETISKHVYELKGYTVVPLKEAYAQQI